ncbi:D-tyrosyl-tRNA(Tyr) deacylase [bacterium]|nr:D-tyrosyl-tRNA(Tyr) deacylase [bacterium]
MRIIVQRVSHASVSVDGQIVGQIGMGLVLLIGFRESDTEEELAFWADKCTHLRIFNDPDEKMNLSLLDVGGEILAISQFTVYGDARKGRRPSFTDAAKPEIAEPLYLRFIALLRKKGIRVAAGIFGAMMEVEIHNSGPVTIILEK